jgi:NAD(P)-dependent dehydrogenase (short-subunit alcohol dehydrogenase family)
VDLALTGRRAVVTGASKGIGLAITRALVAEGATVVAGSLGGSAELDALAEDGSVRSVLIDLSTPSGPAELVDAATEGGAALDVLVNNVGAVRPRLDGFLAISDAEWVQTFTLNFLAAMRTMRAAVPHLRGRPGAAIVTVSSVNAFLPDPGVVDYSAAKAALSNLCKALSKEIGPDVRVNTVSPGPVRTDLWLGASGVAATVAHGSGGDASDVVRQQEAAAPSGRFTYPEEVADLVVFLASERAANITGSDLVIDGGLVTTL